MTVPAEPGRRERRKLALRARILESSAALFSERGFQATRVAEICDQVDIAQKTFFNYFPSKGHVLREIAQLSLAELCSDIETTRKDEHTTRERLQHFFVHAAMRTQEAGPMNRELTTELVHVLNESPDKSEHARKLHDAFGAIVSDGLEAGEVTRRHDADTLTNMILGAYYVLMFNYANLDDFPIRTQAEASARFLGDALAAHDEE